MCFAGLDGLNWFMNMMLHVEWNAKTKLSLRSKLTGIAFSNAILSTPSVDIYQSEILVR